MKGNSMILDKARDLGISLSQSPEFIRMQSARALLDSSEDVSSALNEYKQKQEELLELLSTESPNRIFVASLSRDAEALRTQLLDNPIFAEVLEAQDDFEKLMSQVNKEISACIGTLNESSCSGTCSDCKGCH